MFINLKKKLILNIFKFFFKLRIELKIYVIFIDLRSLCPEKEIDFILTHGNHSLLKFLSSI